MQSVYIHIPFCKYICSYCDFAKRYTKNQDIMAYLKALDLEINSYIEDKIKLKSLYIGGGTPSALNLEELIYLKQIIDKYFEFEDGYEFTFEMNPDDIDDEKLGFLKFMQVNRISIGMQTLNDDILSEVRRGHSAKDCHDALKLISNYFKNVSVDFIFNLPKQNIFDINDTLFFIEQYSNVIKNVSFYGLIMEDNTILNTKEYEYMDETQEENIYFYIVNKLNDIEFKQYEISNFAKEGYESIHNKVYWNNENYYGFGLSASGYISDTRYSNTKNLPNYLKQEDVVTYIEKLDNNDKLYESIMLGLRQNIGIDIKMVEHLNINYDYFDLVNNRLTIKKDKLFIANEAILSLVEQIGD